ncbi:MAG: polysulfide reductase NrfD [Chloroflexi bacterium]|nr:polysulfide reductase NrfD [Chloroflexota bacterium]MBK6712028.1 polysulfide reductase NrfD [Chloroflexota bacterium]MBK7177374.1 polysulfide reductase NrfD [Chloroflexota bacterium]MBK7919695.1 polysulfide reductase NrfD [Chloroflexota bacterium]MBK8932009.1 polysulfide reductase NrfD [Chloroflexota bacterium]
MFKQRLSLLRTSYFWWVAGLLTVIALGLAAAGIIFVKGLVVTNLTDLVPWGLWIGIDLSSIALSGGAFLLSAAVYLLGIKKLQPIARTAVFMGLIGYSMAVLTLMLDIGRPDRFWHSLRYWNIHSPLWEVTMCVTLYLTVLALEVTPIIGQSNMVQSRWPGFGNRLASVHKIAPLLAIAGLGLSMLHQSSLGATYGVLKARPVWYRPGLAVLFIVSAMAAGPSLVTLASILASKVTPRAKIDPSLIDMVARFIGWVLVGYLYLRFWDALSMSYTYEPGRSEGLTYLTKGPFAINFWIGEITLGIIVPMLILLNSKWRQNTRLLIAALTFVVIGLICYRWDTNMVGQLVVFNQIPQSLIPQYTQYRPSLVEMAAGAGVIAYGILAFTFGVRNLGIVDHTLVEEHDMQAVSMQPVATD